MESLGLDLKGDLVMDDDLSFIKNDQELQQTFKNLLKTNKGEWFLDPKMGFDFSVVVGVKKIDEIVLLNALQHVVDQMDEISHVENVGVDFDRKNRAAIIRCDVFTVEGYSFLVEGVI